MKTTQKYLLVASLLGLAGLAVAGEDKWPLPERMRGAVAGISSVTPDTIEWIAGQNANVMVINLWKDEKGKWNDPNRGSVGTAPTKDNPLQPYEHNLKRLDKVLPACREHNIPVIVALTKFWGRGKEEFLDREKGREEREHLVLFWTAMAKRYRDEPAIVGFDVMGEPSWRYDQKMHLTEILPSLVAAIRSVDRNVWISLQPGPGIGPQGMETIQPSSDSRILYCFHHYTPLAYTHQGIKNSIATRGKYTYPGKAPMTSSPTDKRPSTQWDKEALRKIMQPAIDFKRKHGVRILVGEFSAIRFAPGAANYLRDSIAIFEEEGFDWTYFSACGWDGWLLTVDPNADFGKVVGAPKDTGAPTDRLDAVQAGWRLNAAAKP